MLMKMTDVAGTHRALVFKALSSDSGAELEKHAHPEGQIYLVEKGVITIEAGGSRWIMPPGRLGWIPPSLPHAAIMYSGKPPALQGFGIYLKPEWCTVLPTQPTVLALDGLKREILYRMRSWPPDSLWGAEKQRLLQVLIDEVRTAEPETLRLTIPQDKRLAKMATVLVDNPADKTTLDEWAQQLGFSRRSMTRHFRHETGMSIMEWRQIARLERALTLLAEGHSVTQVAFMLGYESVSSFIQLFKQMLGVTPTQLVSGQGSLK